MGNDEGVSEIKERFKCGGGHRLAGCVEGDICFENGSGSFNIVSEELGVGGKKSRF